MVQVRGAVFIVGGTSDVNLGDEVTVRGTVAIDLWNLG